MTRALALATLAAAACGTSHRMSLDSGAHDGAVGEGDMAVAPTVDAAGDSAVPVDQAAADLSTVNRPKSRIGVFRGGTWLVDLDGDRVYTAGQDAAFTFGGLGDVPLVGDWSGDGRFKIGDWRVQNGTGVFSLDWDGDGKWNASIDHVVYWGNPGDTPYVGDWTGTHVYRVGSFQPAQPNNAFFSFDMNGDGAWEQGTDVSVSFGLMADRPVIGDWSGTGVSKIGIYRSGTWNLDWNGDLLWSTPPDLAYSFGTANDLPAVGDWNGDGRAKIATFSDGTWGLDSDGDGVYDSSAGFGQAGDLPVVFWR